MRAAHSPAQPGLCSQPVQFHRQPPDLPVQPLGLAQTLGLVRPALGLKERRRPLQDLFLPLPDLRRMNPVRLPDLVDGLDPPDRLQPDLRPGRPGVAPTLSVWARIRCRVGKAIACPPGGAPNPLNDGHATLCPSFYDEHRSGGDQRILSQSLCLAHPLCLLRSGGKLKLLSGFRGPL
jgi:hypothetical protein